MMEPRDEDLPVASGDREDVQGDHDDRDDLDEGADGADDVDDAGDRPRASDGPDRLHGLIGYMLGLIVSKPEAVKIELNDNDRRRVYEVRVDGEDVGVVIGRSGRTINAIRTLLRGVPDAPERVWVELIEEDEGRGRRPRGDRDRGARDDDGDVVDDVAEARPDDGDDRGDTNDRDDRDERPARDDRDVEEPRDA